MLRYAPRYAALGIHISADKNGDGVLDAAELRAFESTHCAHLHSVYAAQARHYTLGDKGDAHVPVKAQWSFGPGWQTPPPSATPAAAASPEASRRNNGSSGADGGAKALV
jgi:hypothetical protein